MHVFDFSFSGHPVQLYFVLHFIKIPDYEGPFSHNKMAKLYSVTDRGAVFGCFEVSLTIHNYTC